MSRITTERFFSGVDDRIEHLQSALEYIAEIQPTESELVSWIIEQTPGESEENVLRNIAFLEMIDLIEEGDDGYQTTNKGETCWKRDEPLVIYAGLARNVDGFREICRAIQDGQRTVDAIHDVLRTEFSNEQLPEGVVTKHLDWLQSLNLLTESDGEYSIPIEDGTFEVGVRYNRWFIHDVLKGERYKGIATPSVLPIVLLFTGESGSDYGYEDRFLDDDAFIYTGEGTEGDMTMDDGNAAIRDHQKKGESLHLFEDTDMPWIVTYLGEYEYVKHQIDTLPDENGNDRDAIRFTLEPVGGTEVEVDGGPPGSLSLDELYRKAKESAPSGEPVTTTSGTRRSYKRSEYVREYALRVADGACQGCEEDAPFISKSGEPFLEVHHMTRISDGGPDDPENVIALCPNCHRRVHEGQDGEEFNRDLRRK